MRGDARSVGKPRARVIVGEWPILVGACKACVPVCIEKKSHTRLDHKVQFFVRLGQHVTCVPQCIDGHSLPALSWKGCRGVFESEVSTQIRSRILSSPKH